MVKRTVAFIIATLVYAGLAAQTTTLDANNTKAVISANGTLFSGGLEIPKGQGVSSIAVSQIWIGAKHNGGLHIAARLHDSTQQNDFWPGPLDTINGTTAGDTNLWDKIYKITAQQIATHRSQWNKDGYTMPDAIKNWPGSNSTTQPFRQVLALFVDYNGNRKYEPEKGDCPVIKGDEAAYFIINDAANTHFASGGTPLGVEIHGLAYQFANKAGLENTVFLDLTFINRSANNYDSVFAGIWTDFALGAPGDEFISSLPAKNAFFAYNADTFDAKYGNYPPVQAVVFLNRPLQYTIETAKDNGPRGLPQTPDEFYNYLKRYWRDGTPLGKNSNGWLTGPPFVDYIYNGNPCDVNDTGWSEIGSGQPAGQRAMLGSFGPVSLNSGDFMKLELAYIWERSTTNAYASICKLNNSIDDVAAFYKNYISGVQTPITPVFSVYPNPANGHIEINLQNASAQPAQLLITDMQGRTVLSQFLYDDNTQLSTHQLQAGIYALQVTVNGGTATQKLVISH